MICSDRDLVLKQDTITKNDELIWYEYTINYTRKTILKNKSCEATVSIPFSCFLTKEYKQSRHRQPSNSSNDIQTETVKVSQKTNWKEVSYTASEWWVCHCQNIVQIYLFNCCNCLKTNSKDSIWKDPTISMCKIDAQSWKLRTYSRTPDPLPNLSKLLLKHVLTKFYLTVRKTVVIVNLIQSPVSEQFTSLSSTTQKSLKDLENGRK